jgi:hypothetical integral membrane protein (TIGR02206 family)
MEEVRRMNMSGFFSPSATDAFVMFSTSHLISIALCMLIAISLFVFRKQIQSSRSARDFIRYFLAGLLILMEVSLDAWNISEGIWELDYNLPLELCSITLLLSIVMLFTRSRLLYQVLFFAGIGGALQAILTPNLAYAFPHFRFIQFFVAHLAIILASLYMTWIESYRPTWKSVGYAMLFLNILLVGVGAVDYLLDANYMFLIQKPDTPSLLDYLGGYPYYLIVEEFVALIIFAAMYVLFFQIPNLFRKKVHP